MINFHTTTNLWLSLESFYNKGYTPEQVKGVIEKCRDLHGQPFRCEPTGLNGNWIVETSSTDPAYHRKLVMMFEDMIEAELGAH